MTKKSSKKKPTITLHRLLGELSFWGTSARGLLFGFVALCAFLIGLSETTSGSQIDSHIMTLIYVLGSYLLLEVGYILIARAYPLKTAIDALILIGAGTLMALLYVVPKLVVSKAVIVTVDPLLYVAFIPLVVLALRMLLGFLFSNRR